MSWEDIVKQEEEEVKVKKDRNEITDALLIVEDMLQKKYNIALDRVKSFPVTIFLEKHTSQCLLHLLDVGHIL